MPKSSWDSAGNRMLPEEGVEQPIFRPTDFLFSPYTPSKYIPYQIFPSCLCVSPTKGKCYPQKCVFLRIRAYPQKDPPEPDFWQKNGAAANCAAPWAPGNRTDDPCRCRLALCPTRQRQKRPGLQK